MRVGLMTAYNDLYWPLAKIAVPVMQRYCDKWGYKLILGEYHNRLDDDEATRMSRGDLCKAAMYLRFYNDFDLLMWLDVDSIVMNHALPFHAAEHDWLWTYDESGPLSGFWIAKTTPLVKAWVKRFSFATAYEYGGGDQFGMREVMNFPPYRELTKHCYSGKEVGHTYAPERVAPDLQDVSAYAPGDWIITFPGLPLEQRLEYMGAYAAQL